MGSISDLPNYNLNVKLFMYADRMYHYDYTETQLLLLLPITMYYYAYVNCLLIPLQYLSNSHHLLDR